jgi:hypothetical protein
LKLDPLNYACNCPKLWDSEVPRIANRPPTAAEFLL